MKVEILIYLKFTDKCPILSFEDKTSRYVLKNDLSRFFHAHTFYTLFCQISKFSKIFIHNPKYWNPKNILNIQENNNMRFDGHSLVKMKTVSGLKMSVLFLPCPYRVSKHKVCFLFWYWQWYHKQLKVITFIVLSKNEEKMMPNS